MLLLKHVSSWVISSKKNYVPHALLPQIRPIRYSLWKEGGVWWLNGKFDALLQEGRSFESHFSRHVGTLGKSFTRSCL